MEKIFENLEKAMKEMIQVNDGPDDLSLDILIKVDLSALQLPGLDLASMSPGEMLENLMAMSGAGDLKFTAHDIEGGVRIKFSSPESRQEFKDSLDNLFSGNFMKNVMETLTSALGGLADGLGNLGDLFEGEDDD